MKTHLAILSTTLLLVGYSYARIGETKSECQKRYGRSNEKSSTSSSYKKAGVAIFAEFRGDTCCKITYIFPEEAVRKRSSEVVMYPQLVAKLLEANGKRERWVKVDYKNYTKSSKYVSLDSGKYCYFTENLVTFFDGAAAHVDEKVGTGLKYAKGL